MTPTSIVVAVSLLDRHGETIATAEATIPFEEDGELLAGKLIDAAQRAVANCVEVLEHKHQFCD